MPLLKSKKVYIRVSAVKSLGQIGNSSVTNDLLGLIRDPNENHMVRAAGATALGIIHDSNAVEDLLRLTRNEPDKIRIASIESLSTMGTSKVVDGLLEIILSQEVTTIQRSASRALKTIGRLSESRILNILGDNSHKNKSSLYYEQTC